MKTGIYVCKVYPPYLTLEFQEETCRTICQMKNLDNIEIIENLESSGYDTIIIYSLICLGNNLEDIIKTIKKLLDENVKLISVIDPINLNNFGKDSMENMLLSVAIGSALKTNEIWKNITDFRNK